MRKKVYIFFAVFALALPAASTPPQDRTEINPKIERQVKAALLYNFIKFTEWPEDKIKDTNTITIGLLGDDDFSNAFDPVKGKPVKDRKLVVKVLGKFADLQKIKNDNKELHSRKIAELGKCHLLFVCGSEKKHTKEILEMLRGHGVLTIGEHENFLEQGGMICFVPGAKKLEFKINLVVVRGERLRISSRVLRLAKRVIQEKPKK